MMIILGSGDNTFIFKRETLLPNETARQRNQKISTHQRVGQRDKLQYLGAGKDEMALRGSIFPCSNLGTAESLDALDKLAQTGQAHTLIMVGSNNEAEIAGKWMVSDINETHSFYDNTARARKIDFTFKLRRQG